MSFFHCRFRYGQFDILEKTDSSTGGPLDDFVTADITSGAGFQFEEYSGFSDGTTVDSPGAATDDTVIPVVSTTAFNVDDIIAIKLDVDTFHKAKITAFTPDTDVTLSQGISSAAAQGNIIVTIPQLQGSSTGTNTQNFKGDKANQIKKKSFDLEISGFEYNGRDFFLNVNDEGDFDSRFTNDYLRLAAYRGITGIDMSVTSTLDIDERPYNFADAADFDDFFEAYYGSPDRVTVGRILEIYGGGTGQSGLITEVTEAGNDQTSMNNITDTRT
jgi:hypothetical protein